MCPKACGFQKKCFCRDSKKLLSLPKKVTTRQCKDISVYSTEDKKHWCTESKQPLFARSCPLICGNKYCVEEKPEDSVDTLSFNNGQIHTSCWLISTGDGEYKKRFCNNKETDLQVYGSVLCPIACGGF